MRDYTVFNNIVNSFGLKGKNPYLVLDMVCNAATRKLQWVDGSTITYTPKGSSDISFDCVNVHNTTVSMTDANYWTNIQTDSSRMDTILCVTIDQEEQCGGYTLMDDAKIPKPCYKVYSEPLPWNAAQKQCDADYGSLITINNADVNANIFKNRQLCFTGEQILLANCCHQQFYRRNAHWRSPILSRSQRMDMG
ncbi:hypothetical protein PRIPAC_87015 [Pristionchus pacificus]|nr:hypothetical protein PRIPAC_87015 [Pristionchus pacificus]